MHRLEYILGFWEVEIFQKYFCFCQVPNVPGGPGLLPSQVKGIDASLSLGTCLGGLPYSMFFLFFLRKSYVFQGGVYVCVCVGCIGKGLRNWHLSLAWLVGDNLEENGFGVGGRGYRGQGWEKACCSSKRSKYSRAVRTWNSRVLVISGKAWYPQIPQNI